MAISEPCLRQVALLVRSLPFIAAETCFALKGGTAINLFIRNMPRVSVDIDLTYLPVADRRSSLLGIDTAMRRIGRSIETGIRGSHVIASGIHSEDCVTKLVVREGGVQIKIEVTPVLRGCVYEPTVKSVCAGVEDRFGYAEIQVVSFADLNAGKIVAALDRQHPRDLFDVRDLLAHQGISDELRKAFIVYLLSHNRPMAEVLAPLRMDISQEFSMGFDGMTDVPVTLGDLQEAREAVVTRIVGGTPEHHRRFLISTKLGEPDWNLLDLPGAEGLPAVRWRLENLAKMDEKKRAKLLRRLSEVLGMGK